MPFNIVLVEPEIPNNTGNIGRLALATGSTLHLVKPFGFELDDKRVKRAGLDYWPHLDLHIYESLEDFLSQHGSKNLVLFSSHGTENHWSIPFEDGQFFLFGKESVGLPSSLLTSHKKDLYKIPLYSDHVRSLNLANAVGIAVYEGLKHIQ
ncbi:tRNA (cytidine(34)-2'-O)-methyltransferase [Zobellia amurskyensis]|uniref:Putative tRNA (cytidine(34)-2'-O)-methyltransferase n=1 Tax=Zobellia amurskyensis TaxID=248905 RepID=A0A7X2ZTA7_9FLAO|nr:tRNA (cytidine(34)-2'-O)-methyltransferase [Zobellia amurskyensis]MUH36023.1 tRNA (cytidine(34)-2'-O)-methyltransferase [Zobellia amurskyensis]